MYSKLIGPGDGENLRAHLTLEGEYIAHDHVASICFVLLVSDRDIYKLELLLAEKPREIFLEASPSPRHGHS